MSAAPHPGRRPVGPNAAGATAGRGPSTTAVLRSEWRKLRTLRSTVLTALAAAGGMVFFGVVNAVDNASEWSRLSGAQQASIDALPPLIGGWFLAQVMIGVLGVLAVTSEYSSGSMASTLAAVPRRLPVLVAKLVVPAGATFALFVPATVGAIVAGGLLLPDGMAPDPSDGDVLRVAFGVPLAMAAVCAMGAAAGFVIRSAAGAIGVLVTALLVLPGLVAGFSKRIYQWLPGGAIDAILTTDRAEAELPLLAPGAGALLLALYLAGLVALAAWSLVRRDA